MSISTSCPNDARHCIKDDHEEGKDHASHDGHEASFRSPWSVRVLLRLGARHATIMSWRVLARVLIAARVAAPWLYLAHCPHLSSVSRSRSRWSLTVHLDRVLRTRRGRHRGPAPRTTVTLVSVIVADIAGWLTAGATTPAAIAAIVAGYFAFGAFRQQNEQLKLAMLQERDRRADRAVEVDETRKRQARLISAWVDAYTPVRDEWSGTDMTPLFIANTSGEPVYNIVATLVLVQGAGAPQRGEDWARRHQEKHDTPMTTAAILPPGRWRVLVRGTHWTSGMGLRAAAEVAFTDRAGAHWIRRGTGDLEELDEPPIQYFERHGFYGPHELVTPEPVL